MYVLTAQWLFPVLVVVWVKRATADAQITPPTLVTLLRARETQSPTIISTITSVNPLSGLSFCFGTGSICDYANQLSSDCQSFEDNVSDLSQWYQCICENGYVSTNQQCDWCQLELESLTPIDTDEFSECSSYGFSVAPIPSSILAAESSYNATAVSTTTAFGTSSSIPTSSAFTSTIGGGNSGPTVTPATSTPTTTSAGQTTTSATKAGGATALDSKAPALLAMVVSAVLLLHRAFF